MTRQEVVRDAIFDALSERVDALERYAADLRRTLNDMRRAEFRTARSAPVPPDDLRSRRLRAGLSQREAARKAGLSRGQVCDLESGRRAGVRSLPVYLAMLERVENSPLTATI